MSIDSTVALKGRSSTQDSSKPVYPTLSSARFELRPFTMRDIAPLTSMAREHRVADTAIGFPHPYTSQFARMWISSHEEDWQTGRALHWAAARYGAPQHLSGYAGLVHIDRERCQGELRFWVGCGVERQRDAQEWSAAVIGFAFGPLAMERVYGLQMCRHRLAGHVMENLGMRRVAALRRRVFPEGPMEDIECWSIQSAEWQFSLNR